MRIVSTLAALTLAMTAAASPALAQPSPTDQPTELREIVVYGLHIVRKPVGVAAGTGARIEVFSVAKHVEYADLDLTQASDVATLRQRIDDSAKAACARLETEYPSSMYPPAPGSEDCVKNAVADATPLADQIIAAAQ